LLAILVLDSYASPRRLPWKPLNLEEPIGLATGMKLIFLSIAPSTVCFEKLASAKQLSYEQFVPKNEGSCGWKTAATMSEVSNNKFKPKVVTSQCPLMLASYFSAKTLGQRCK